MKAILFLSPSKTQKPKDGPPPREEPPFIREARKIATSFEGKTGDYFARREKVSLAKGEEICSLWDNWLQGKKVQAGYLYSGPAFEALNWPGITKRNPEVKPYILSTLYGLVPPEAGITPYRLDFTGEKGLYPFWKEKIRKHLSQEEPDLILDLASGEYSRLIPRDLCRVIRFDFREKRGDQWKSISYTAKKMRGKMARWILDRPSCLLDQIGEATIQGYRRNPQLSQKDLWIYTPV